jgi:hypothetical protein
MPTAPLGPGLMPLHLPACRLWLRCGAPGQFGWCVTRSQHESGHRQVGPIENRCRRAAGDYRVRRSSRSWQRASSSAMAAEQRQGPLATARIMEPLWRYWSARFSPVEWADHPVACHARSAGPAVGRPPGAAWPGPAEAVGPAANVAAPTVWVAASAPAGGRDKFAPGLRYTAAEASSAHGRSWEAGSPRHLSPLRRVNTGHLSQWQCQRRHTRRIALPCALRGLLTGAGSRWVPARW